MGNLACTILRLYVLFGKERPDCEDMGDSNGALWAYIPAIFTLKAGPVSFFILLTFFLFLEKRGTGCVVFIMRSDPGQPRVFYSFASIAHFVLLTECEEQA